MHKIEMALWVIFVVSSGLYWWVGKIFISQPDYNVPQIFRNPMAARTFVLFPQLGFVAVVISGFVFTEHGWWFLGAIIGAVVLFSSRPQQF
ncbi:hypothetical protein QQM79_20955 [Marinobacteraceae bacterium S3BR75-40.1]